MVGLPFDTDNPQPAIRKPLFTIVAGEADSGGALDALAGAASDLLGGGEGVDPWQRTVQSITVQQGLAPIPDHATIVLRADSDAPSIALDDKLQLSLGYQDSDAVMVLSGHISRIQRDIRGSYRITLANGAHRLLRARINSSFEDQSAGDIVSHLADATGVETDSVDDGVNYPFYVVDDRRSLYHHMVVLAQQNGFALYFSAQGKLNFAPLNGDSVAQFHYGIDLIALQHIESPALFGQVTVVGSGAAGSDGADAWPWVTDQRAAISAQDGSGNAAAIARYSALRSADAVKTAAAAQLDYIATKASSGRLRVPGAPAVLPGSAFEIASTPEGALDGKYIAQRVTHSLNKRGGFVTDITFTGQPGNSNGFGGLGGSLSGGLF